MKLILLFLTFISFPLFSQDRNENVRRLNEIVSYMDEFSRINQNAYHDVRQLANAIHHSCEKINPNYFYSEQTLGQGRMSFSGIESSFRFEELKPFPDKSLPSYMAKWISYLESREKIAAYVIHWKYGSPELGNYVSEYMKSADSLFAMHQQLNAYVAEKHYENDPSFVNGKQLLQDFSVVFEMCHQNSILLTLKLKQDFKDLYPPNKFHPELQNALSELQLTVNLLDEWQTDLYKGNQVSTPEFDRRLKEYNVQGLSRDSSYLFKTKGYGRPNSGWWAHTRYRTFYTSMQSGIYWYATTKIYPEKFLDKKAVDYNGFINGYNSAIEDYNDFTAIMDGKTFREESKCCLGPEEIDLHENVMLNYPRLLYKYIYVDPCKSEITTIPEKLNDPTDLLKVQSAVPHHLVYLLDVSGSMNESGKIETLRESTKYLVELQDSKHRMSVVLFSESENVLLENIPCSEKQLIFEKIDALRANGYTKLKSGIEAAVKTAEANIIKNGKTKIVLITDGVFELDKQTKKRISALESKGISFSVIFLGTAKGTKHEKQLINLCASTNGRFHTAGSSDFKNALLIEAVE